MQDQTEPRFTSQEAPAPTDAPAAPEPSWSTEVENLLLAAAALCVEHEVDPDSFMQACWAACLDARPGLRAQIEETQLAATIENLRSRGIVGSA